LYHRLVDRPRRLLATEEGTVVEYLMVVVVVVVLAVVLVAVVFLWLLDWKLLITTKYARGVSGSR